MTKGLHPTFQRFFKGGGVDGIDIIGQGKSAAIRPLYHISNHRARARGDLPFQRRKMFGAARGDAIRKLGFALPLQMDVLDLDVARRAVIRLQQQIDARILVISDLAPDLRHSRQAPARHRALIASSIRRLGCMVLMPTKTTIRLDQLQGQRQLALGIGRARKPDLLARMIQAEHAPRVRAMHRRLLAVFENDIGEKALVALDQAPGYKRVRPLHAAA